MYYSLHSTKTAGHRTVSGMLKWTNTKATNTGRGLWVRDCVYENEGTIGGCTVNGSDVTGEENQNQDRKQDGN